MVHIWGVLRSTSGPHCGVGKWSTSFRPIKRVVSEDFCERSFQRGCEVIVAFWSFGPKTGFSKRGWQTLPFSISWSGGCWWMLLVDYKKGMAKKTYQTIPFLREGKGRQEERGQRSKKKHHFYTVFWGLKKRAGSCSTLLGPKISVLKICYNPYFQGISRER